MRSTIPSLIALSTVLADASCVETRPLPREDHCAQQAGDQWCAEQYPDGSRPFCGRGHCELGDQQDPIARDGCLAERPADDTCYSPCGDGTTVLEDPSCRVPEASTGSTTTASTTDEPSTGGDTSVDPLPVCGNGLLEDDETCDDGVLNGTLGQCDEGCQGIVVGCGDGQVQGGELCDDGDGIDGNGCNTDCRPSGMVVWEHQDVRYGIAYDVDVGPNGTVYAVGQAKGLVTAAWAGRLSDTGAVEWSYELPTPDGNGWPGNAFRSVSAKSEDGLWVGGKHDSSGQLVRLDSGGGLVETLPVPGVATVGRLARLPDGDFLIKHGGTHAFRIDGLVQEWEITVGMGLAYRWGDNVALAAAPVGAGFRRFTLDGDAFSPVVFPVADGISAESRAVTWASDSDVVAAGRVYSDCCEEALVLKSSSGGQLRWMYGPQQLAAQYREAHCVAVDSSDAVIVGGWAVFLGEIHPFLMKLSVDGDVLWTRQLEFQAVNAVIWGCATTPTDEIIVVGTADEQFWFAKLTP